MSALPKAFLDDIAANIDDDTPRLVYADWLEENGNLERAEFIRVQIERARLPAWDAAQVRLRIREKQLLDAHGEQWLKETPTVSGAKWEGFRRGIVAEVSFDSYESMRTNAHKCRVVAPVEAVTVRWPRNREPQTGGPPIAELRELSVTGRPADLEEIARLAGSPQLATLRKLTLHGLWSEGFARLVRSPHLAGLKVLRLPGNSLGNDGITALVRAPGLKTLEEIDLSGRGVAERYNDDPIVRSPGVEALAAWPGLASVRVLNLSGNEFGRAGLRGLLRSPHAAALKELSVRGGRLDGQAMAELDTDVRNLQLDVLDVGANILKDVGAEYVALAPSLTSLKVLRLDRCEITLTGARLLAKKAAFLTDLRVLNVEHNHFGLAGLTALLDRKPKALHTLLMRDNDLGDDGGELLAGSPATDGLRELDVSQNGMKNNAAMYLSEAAHLGELVSLKMTDTPLKDWAKEALRKSPLGQRLASLDLDGPPPPPNEKIPF
jgi:uncharacterized protein (TIGR02996 family)